MSVFMPFSYSLSIKGLVFFESDAAGKEKETGRKELGENVR